MACSWVKSSKRMMAKPRLSNVIASGGREGGGLSCVGEVKPS